MSDITQLTAAVTAQTQAVVAARQDLDEAVSSVAADVASIQDFRDDFGDLTGAITTTLGARDSAVAAAGTTTTNAATTVAAKNDTLAARDVSVGASNAANVALAAKDTRAIGRATVADGATFWVKPNATDGITRYSQYLRVNSTTDTFVASLSLGSEVDLLNTAASTFVTVNATNPNALTATSTAITTLPIGRRVRFRAAATTTAGSPTLAINGASALIIYDAQGVALEAGAIVNGYYYELAINTFGNGWIVLASGTDPIKLRALGLTSPTLLTGLAGTGNAITANSSTLPANIGNGARMTFVPVAVNVAGGVTISIAGVSNANAWPLIDFNGAPLAAGALQVGRLYAAIFYSNCWRLEYTSIDRERLNTIELRIPTLVTGVAGTANAITGTAATLAVFDANTRITLKGALTNTQAGPTIALNGGPAAAIVLGSGGPAPIGAIRAGYFHELQYTLPGNVWTLKSNGVLSTDIVASLTDQVDANLAAIKAMITATPLGSQTYADGAMTQINNVIKTLGAGSSVSNGDGARHPNDPAGVADWAPATRFGAFLAEELGVAGKWTSLVENKGVGGSFDNEIPDQLAARSAGFTAGHIFLPSGGMNSATTFGTMRGATLPGQINGLRTACKTAIAAGYLPILQKTMHPHPYWMWSDAGTGVTGGAPNGDMLEAWNWPSITMYVTATITVDATNNTVTSTAFTEPTFGGLKMGAASKLVIADGPNAGTHVLQNRSGTQLNIVPGSLVASETAARLVSHKVTPAENETLMPIPPSKRYVKYNRTGKGAVMGLRFFDLYNQHVGLLAKELGVPCIECDAWAFDFVLDNGGDNLVWTEGTRVMSGTAPGYDAGYTTTYGGNTVLQRNHPNIALRTATYERGAREIARLLRTGGLTRHTVIR